MKNNLNRKKYCKVRDHCNYTGEYRGAAHSICKLKYSIPKEIPVLLHNVSNNDYHLIIKNQQNNLKDNLVVQEERILKKYIIFSVPIEK